MKRKQNAQSTNKKKSKRGGAINSDTEDEIPVRRKQSAKKNSRKSIVINSDSEKDCDKENDLTSRFDKIEYKEWVLALKEHEIDLREQEAKVYLMELSNLEKERELKLVK